MVKEREADIGKAFIGELKKCYRGKIFLNLKTLKFKMLIKYFSGYLRLYIFPSFFKLKREPYIPINDLSENIVLKDIYDDTKNLLKMYQEICPSVINNGTKQSFGGAVFGAISTWIIPIIAGIPVAIKVYGWIKDLIFEIVNRSIV